MTVCVVSQQTLATWRAMKQAALLLQRDRASRLSVEILQLENYSTWAIVWQYLCNPTFSRFDTDRYVLTDRQTDDDGKYRASIASCGKN